MKAVTFLLLMAAICQFGHATVRYKARNNLIYKFSTRSIADRFKEALENFKEVLRNGNATAGIPVYDPLNVSHKDFNFETDLTKFQGTINDLLAEGLSNYIVQNSDFTFTGKKISVDLLWSEVTAKTEYKINSGEFINFPFYGTGEARLLVKGVRFATDAKITWNEQADKLIILSFENTIFTLKDIKIDITGLYDDEEMSAMLSAIITDNISDYIKDFQVSKLNSVMLRKANEYLSTKSLKEIINNLSS